MYNQTVKRRILSSYDAADYLEELIRMQLIKDEKALGIAKKVVAEGSENLTENQWYRLIEKGLLPDNFKNECELCSGEIPWSEMMHAVYFYEDNLCSYCHHKLEKLDKE